MAITSPVLRKWLAFGTGVGVEIGQQDLRVAVVEVRPAGKRLRAERTIENFGARPASDWGAEYAELLASAGASRYPATVVLPRSDLTVRQLALPGVEDRDLAAAVSYQIDSLHPYQEEEIAFTFARLPAKSEVLVGITRKEVVERYANLFAEAGIRVACFTFSAAALYSALRFHEGPPPGFLTLVAANGLWEAYGESPARPVFSAAFEQPLEEVVPLALSELRLEADQPLSPIDELLSLPGPEHGALPAAAAMCSACPRLALEANLLPQERRAQLSRLVYAPTVVLGILLLAAFAALSAQRSYADSRYLKKLEAEIATLEKEAAKAAELDTAAGSARSRLAQLERFRSRSRADADALREVTGLLAPPAWLHSLQMNRAEVFLSGEAESAAALLKLLDESSLFHDSGFAQPLSRVGSGVESFVIRTLREGPGVRPEPGDQR